MSFSIIVPTCGRATTGQTLQSITHQMDESDELIVVSDSFLPKIAELVADVANKMPRGRIVHHYTDAVTRDNGGSQRDLGILVAQGDWLLFMDSDDIYTRNALDEVRQSLVESGVKKPHIFKMQGGSHSGWTDIGGGSGWTGTLWKYERLAYGNVGTPMVVCPCVEGLPLWSRHDKNGHDFGWICDVSNMFNGVVWVDKVISIIRPSAEEVRREIP